MGSDRVPARTQRAQETPRHQRGQQCDLSERLALGEQLSMANLSAPSPTLTPAGVGRNTPRGSWDLTPPPTRDWTPTSKKKEKPFSMISPVIRGLVNNSINPALRPHLQIEYNISDQDLAKSTMAERSTHPRRGCSAAAASQAAVVHHHLLHHLHHPPVVHPAFDVVAVVAAAAMDDDLVL